MTEQLNEQRIHCPYCGEAQTFLVDPSMNDDRYIEDCQICCRPIECVLDAERGEIEVYHENE